MRVKELKCPEKLQQSGARYVKKHCKKNEQDKVMNMKQKDAARLNIVGLDKCET